MSNKKQFNNVLIITSSGGGGLLQAGNAKEQEIKKNHPDAAIIKKDVLKDWVWKGIGLFSVKSWNQAQRSGKLLQLRFYGYMKIYAEKLFWFHIFFSVYRTLKKENIDHVIDTQVMGTSAILKAIRLYNHFFKKKVFLEKVIVDLPTDKASHFFHNIKKLSKKDRKLLKVISIPPLLEKGQTREEFWQKHCGLSDSEICYDEYYVRQSFKDHKDLPRDKQTEISVCFASKEEREMAEKVFLKGPILAQYKENEAVFTLDPEDRLITILLGSQPAYGATTSYVMNLLDMIRSQGNKKQKYAIFAFCSDHEPEGDSLLKQLHDHLLSLENYPENVSVVLMPFQDQRTIACLFARSDLTITRSGGQTVMELMLVNKGKSFIHSEIKPASKKKVTQEMLMRGFPSWEGGNARYLKEKKGAEIVTPDTIAPYCGFLFSK